LVCRLIICSPSQWTTKCSFLKEASLCHVTCFKIWSPIHISGMAKARALKLCKQGDYITSCQRDDKSPLKGVVWLMLPIFACATVDFEKFHQGTPLTAINNVVDDGSCFSHLWLCQYAKAQAPSILFLVYLLQPCLYNTSTTNRPSGVWALPCIYVLITV